MDIKIDEIVKQVLSEIDTPSRPVQPKTTFVLEETPALTGREVGKTAVLDSQEDYMIKNYVLPEVGPKEILVCVEGCMISPSDVTEFLKERRAAGSSAQGQEGTGIIVKVGSENLQDAKGNVLKVGDKVIAAKKAGFGGVSTYGGRKANTVAPNGWFANYIVLPAGQQVYQVNGLDLESRLLITRSISIYTEVERMSKMCKLDADKTAVVLGCGMEGLLTVAALKTLGINKIIVIDKESEKSRAMEFGAWEFIGSHGKNGVAGVKDKIRAAAGDMADAVFICTDSPMGRNVARRFMKNSGSICEMGFLCGWRRTPIARYFEDSMPAGGRFYAARDYENCMNFLTKAAEMKLPLYKLITHRYKLEEINEAMWTVVREEGLGIAVFNR